MRSSVTHTILKKAVRVRLSVAQDRLFRQEIEAAQVIGDCRREGWVLVFDDYEGLQATLNLFMKKSLSGKTSDYRSFDSVVDRIAQAVKSAL